MSVNVLEQGDKMSVDFVKAEFFDKIEGTLRESLKIACYPKSKARERSGRLVASQRYLEDHFITISDLILFYFMSNVIQEHATLKSELERSYERICSWYASMKNDSGIRKSFLDFDQQPSLVFSNQVAGTVAKVEQTSEKSKMFGFF